MFSEILNNIRSYFALRAFYRNATKRDYSALVAPIADMDAHVAHTNAR